MASILLQSGEKVHIITRRQFDGDLRRHFVGVVDAVTEVAARVTGYVFILDTNTHKYVKRPTPRTRIFSLIDAGHIINLIPPDVAIDQLTYDELHEGRLVCTDSKQFHLDINEFGASR